MPILPPHVTNVMNEILETYRYELIDITFEFPYVSVEESTLQVCEEEANVTKCETENQKLERDELGIPMGQSIPEIKERETIIDDFLRRWSASNTERKVHNSILNEYIYVRAISVVEAKEHSSKSYRSTIALMLLEEVLKGASPIKRVPKKNGDQNQKEFEHFLVMLYKHPNLGSIKLTVGVKKSQKKIQYGITALKADEQLIDYSAFKKKQKKKRSPK